MKSKAEIEAIITKLEQSLKEYKVETTPISMLGGTLYLGYVLVYLSALKWVLDARRDVREDKQR